MTIGDRVVRTWMSMTLAAAVLLAAGIAPAQAANVTRVSSPAVRYDVSAPLRDIAPASSPATTQKKEHPKHNLPSFLGSPFDPVIQGSPGAGSAPALGAGFEGLGAGLGGFTVNSAPSDSNGAAGPNHYVEVVNSGLAIFSKAGGGRYSSSGGTPIYGPVPTNTLWHGFGGGCEANNDGDATVAYDRLSDRWIVSQFTVTSPSAYGYGECVAVSTTGDPTGSYARYEFSSVGGNFPDYPKLGVWPDGYYTTFNMFRGNTFVGPAVCAYDRSQMLNARPATQQCFSISSTTYGGLLPSDLDGSTPPPSGSPNYLLAFGSNSLMLWKFHVDWATPSSSSLTGPGSVANVASFSPACSGGGTCIPQAGTTEQLDSLGDRLMYRLAYRNLGSHESLVVNQSVSAGTSVGVRWYELRDPNGSPAVFQQGTYAPDANYRWMGSAAMDRSGDIGLGFSISGTGLNPGIHYTGRLASDPTLNVMDQGEGTLIDGTGSQTTGLNRWGDYSSLSVDPVDDCSFWYANQYLTTNGTFNWHTRVGSFKLPGCGAPDFSLWTSGASQSVTQGNSTSYTLNTTPVGGFSGSVALSVSGLPAGATGSFSPNATTPPGTQSSALSVSTAATTPAGSYPLTVTATSGSITHVTTVTLTVNAPAPPAADFSLSASPSSQTVARGASTSYTVSVTPINGFNGSVSLSVSGLPPRAGASFSPNPTTSRSTMTVTTRSRTSPGTYHLMITGTSGSLSHAAQSVTLIVN